MSKFNNLNLSIKHMPIGVFLFALFFLTVLENVKRGYAYDNIHFQFWSSDDMMQTLPAAQLREAPIKSLWYLHKQPPAYDFLRMLSSQLFEPGDTRVFIAKLDSVLYVLWALLFAWMSLIVFKCLNMECGIGIASCATFVWIINPAPIFYATFLDGTILSSALFTWFLYEIYLLKIDKGNVIRVALACVLLFYTRTVFQWYFFIVVVVSLFLMKTPVKKVLIFSGICLLLVFPFMLKQYLLFGTIDSTTFSGYHKCGIIGYKPTVEKINGFKRNITHEYPASADNYNGGDDCNTKRQCQDNAAYTMAFNERLVNEPINCFENILKSIALNSKTFWMPSANYQPHVICHTLFWCPLFLFIFSHLPYMMLITIAILSWFLTNKDNFIEKLFAVSGIALPFLYVMQILHLSNRYDWTEVDRLKFIIEPCLYIFIVTQLVSLFKTIKKLYTNR